MSENLSIDNLRRLLLEVRKHPFDEKELTIFSLGGRGHYENPISDLLAFFLRPNSGHGLGSLFMEALLESMPPKVSQEEEFPVFDGMLERFSVHREKDTRGGGRIDFLLKGNDWVMLIENKIYHSQDNNPFKEYERFGEKIASGKKLHLVILSPSGKSSAKGWYGVSYETYITNLKIRLGKIYFDENFTKWHLFAREFVMHIENELYSKSMNEEQIRLVEENQSEIAQLEKLKVEYRKFLISRLKEITGEFFEESRISIKDDGWALRCRCQDWGHADIAWWYSDLPKVELNLSIYLEKPSQEQIDELEHNLDTICRMESGEDGEWLHWKTVTGFQQREEAEIIFKEFIKLLNMILSDRKIPIQESAIMQ